MKENTSIEDDGTESCYEIKDENMIKSQYILIKSTVCTSQQQIYARKAVRVILMKLYLINCKMEVIKRQTENLISPHH